MGKLLGNVTIVASWLVGLYIGLTERTMYLCKGGFVLMYIW